MSYHFFKLGIIFCPQILFKLCYVLLPKIVFFFLSPKRKQRSILELCWSHDLSVMWSISHVVCQSHGPSVMWSISHVVCQPCGLSVTWSISHVVCQSCDLSVMWPITNMAWVRAWLCKSHKRVHLTRSHKW